MTHASKKIVLMLGWCMYSACLGGSMNIAIIHKSLKMVIGYPLNIPVMGLIVLLRFGGIMFLSKRAVWRSYVRTPMRRVVCGTIGLFLTYRLT